VTPNTFLSNPPTLSLENLLGDKGLVGPVAEKGINEQFERLVSEGFFQYVVNSNIREEERPIVWNSGLTAAADAAGRTVIGRLELCIVVGLGDRQLCPHGGSYAVDIKGSIARLGPSRLSPVGRVRCLWFLALRNGAGRRGGP
jgi:hypothetical protein